MREWLELPEWQRLKSELKSGKSFELCGFLMRFARPAGNLSISAICDYPNKWSFCALKSSGKEWL